MVLNARICTIVVSAKQKEIYELRKVNGSWLIDDITVKEEKIEEKNHRDKKYNQGYSNMGHELFIMERYTWN